MHTAALISAHQYQGQSNHCGPLSAAIVSNALCEKQLDGFYLAEEMNKIRWQGILPVVRRIPNWATFPWGVVDILREQGMQANWRVGRTKTWLHENLSGTKILLPIIGEWRPLWAHIMILIAFDNNKGWGFVNPAHREQAIYWMQDKVFTRQWKQYGRIVIEVKHA